MTAITDTKLRDKLLKEKKLELKKTIEMIKQNTYERKNRKNTIPEVLISHREKEIKEEPIQRMERSETRPNNNFTTEKPCKFCMHCTELESHSQKSGIGKTLQHLWKERTFRTGCEVFG